MVRAALVVLGRVEPDDAAGSGASGASGPLLRGGFADAADFEGGESCPRRVGGDAGEAGIDDDANAVDGEGAFGDVSCQDQFALVRRVDRAILFGGWKVAVERSDQEVVAAGRNLAGARGAANFGRAWEEYQNVAGFFDHGCESVGNLIFERVGGVRGVSYFERV